ncbi:MULTISPECIES: two-component system sensor histidine kinase PmrB [Enterobacter]|uniref:two-component system sensor histidine kinase PmrB n=1 Tax=Enterobacter TaxID=547 RepID=UPI0028F13830|nr:two-component system sensor histidine kinase PmrB [Enterobacter cloacae]HDR2787383.1 two-component system sensor histidine kinase PmrB [Enterobacter asburiae]WNT36015.1 two-component system sensor histidine kinase PmrB [Enterobacter cloacae]HDR2793165.1 two-component system sensor histidine kinase PmrB [Enterobacter asburiae]HDR2798570.1 two-component system sensor histidine kinase PmrB [Enterobacter asburiae]HDR2803623.1 two-component system sensor histidine kinase PmrB [Enterobacter asbur
MNSMRRRLMVLLAVILLFFQLISVVWLWHESREQISFLVSETLSAKARNNHVEKEIREAIASLLVPSLVMVSFTLLFSFWAVTWITRPLNQLRDSLANRSADNLTPLPMYSDMEEIGAVTTSLNQLLARLDHTIQQERLFTADAAHELRTPLAGIRLHLELMAQAGSAQAKTLISRIDQLMHTVEQLLMLARAGQALASGHYDTLVWTENIIAPLGLEHEAKEHKVIWPEKSPLTVQGDAVLLRLMLRNLLENAARYSPTGTTITVRITQQDDGTQVSVIDQGPGIDEAHRQSITEPFRRLDQRYGGSGLGLSIVQRIVQLHHGRLTLENGPEGGLIASCWLPSMLS